MLHTVNKSPFASPLLATCLDCLQAGDAVLLINDGVYGALPGSPLAERIAQLTAQGCRFFVLEEDAQRRSLPARRLAGVDSVDAAGFVALAIQHPGCQSWY